MPCPPPRRYSSWAARHPLTAALRRQLHVDANAAVDVEQLLRAVQRLGRDHGRGMRRKFDVLFRLVDADGSTTITVD